MQRFSVCVMGLGIMFAVWTVPVSAQDKYTMGWLQPPDCCPSMPPS